jgi:uncharacterized protein
MASSPTAPAGHGVVASLAAVAVVIAGSWFGVKERNVGNSGTGDATSFDALTPVTTTPPATTIVAAPASVVDAAATTVVAEPTTTPPPVVDAGEVPTVEDPLRLYIAGDSDAQNLGPPLQRELERTGLVDSTLFYKVASGLARPDFFDWPAQLQSDVAKLDPDVVVVTFGGNDAQDLLLDGRSFPVDTPEWRAEYGSRVGAVMDFLGADGRKLIWVGIPNAQADAFRARLQILEEVTRAEAAKRPDVVYFDTWNTFVGRSGGYANSIIDPRDGQGKLVRQDDGFHLNVAGSEILGAYYITPFVLEEMRTRGASV